MSKNLMAHEKAVRSFAMFFQMLLVALILSFGLHIGYTYFKVSNKTAELKKIKIPYTKKKISRNAIIKYYFNTSFGVSDKMTLPEEFRPMFKRSPKLSRLLKNNFSIKRSVYKVFLNKYYNGYFKSFPDYVLKTFKTSAKIYLFVLLYILFFIYKSQKVKNDEFLRGSIILSINKFKSKMKALCKYEKVINKNNNIIINEIITPRESEQKHMLILGATGTGKSVFLDQIISQSINRQKSISTPEVSIFYDVKGTLRSKYWDDDSILFYPFDKHSVGWNFLNEIRSYEDFDILSTMLFEPPKNVTDPYWYNSARDVFRAGIYALFLMDGGDYKSINVKNRDILNFFNGDIKTMKEVFFDVLPTKDQAAIKHVDKHDSAQAASVISILQERLTFFKYIYDLEGDFSFRDFIQNYSLNNKNLFLLNITLNESIFKQLMSFVVDIMINETLSLPDIILPDERRINFFIDEFGSLSKLSSVFNFLTMARSKGGALYIANQDLGFVSDIYGKDKKETFFNNFNSSVTFMLNDPTTAEFLSKAYGEQEIIQKSGDSRISPNSLSDSYSIRDNYKINKVILPSQFLNLRTFNYYFKYSDVGFCKLMLPKNFVNHRVKPFIPINSGNIQEIETC